MTFKKIRYLFWTEFALRWWLGLLLIYNAQVGLIIPLEDLGMPEPIYRILKGLWETGFMMHLVKGIELLVGLLLVCNAFIPLALLLIAPVIVNIYGVHLFLFHQVLTQGLAMLLVCLFLFYRKKEVFKPLVKWNA